MSKKKKLYEQAQELAAATEKELKSYENETVKSLEAFIAENSGDAGDSGTNEEDAGAETVETGSTSEGTGEGDESGKTSEGSSPDDHPKPEPTDSKSVSEESEPAPSAQTVKQLKHYRGENKRLKEDLAKSVPLTKFNQLKARLAKAEKTASEFKAELAKLKSE